MNIALKGLLRLSQLRLDAKTRALHLARLDLGRAEANIVDAKAVLETTRTELAKQRDATREVFLGSVHARQAVETLITDLSGLDVSEKAAEQAVTQAEATRDEAAIMLGEARTAMRLAQAKLDKRNTLADQSRKVVERARETRAETDALEQWTAGQGLQ